MNRTARKFKIDSRKIAVTAIYAAAAVILDLLDIGNLIPIFGVKITLLLIPVILAAQNDGFFTALVVGTIFGLLSLIGAYTKGGLFALFFYNPLISVLPRMLIGVTAFFVFKVLRKHNFYLAAIVSTITGVVTNTGLVLGSVLLWGGLDGVAGNGSTWLQIVVGILSFNFPIELAFCLITVPAATYALHKARKLPVGKQKKTDGTPCASPDTAQAADENSGNV